MLRHFESQHPIFWGQGDQFSNLVLVTALSSCSSSPSWFRGAQARPALQQSDLPASLISLLFILHIAICTSEGEAVTFSRFFLYGSFTSMPFIERD